MSAIFDDANFWQAVGYVLGTALATLVVAIVARYASRWLKEAWWTLRVYVPTVIMQVDQPGDPLLVYLGGKLEAFWPSFEQNAAAFLPAFLRALADGIDEVVGNGQAKPGDAEQATPIVLEPDDEVWPVGPGAVEAVK